MRHRSVFAVSRRMNFWILPVEVLGSGPNTTVLGNLEMGHVGPAEGDHVVGRGGPVRFQRDDS